MGKYLITGRQGSGKTSVIRRLEEIGHTAYNIDDILGVTRLEDSTGQLVGWPDGPIDWSYYRWNWQSEQLKQLLANDDTVFVGAVTGNQTEFYPLFDRIFVLIVDAHTLRQHLETHEHNYTPEDIGRILEGHEANQPRFIAEGCIPINNNGSLDATVQAILEQTDASR